MHSTAPPTKLDKAASIAQIATTLSVVLGIILALAEISKTAEEMRASAQAAKLTALPTVTAFIEKDVQLRNSELQSDQDWNRARISEALAKYPTVESAYHSDDLKSVRTVGHHYEILGALVRTNYIDFNLVYEVVPFPDTFWAASDELRTRARGNWDGKQPLKDFWSNFEYLRSRYCERRAQEGEPCKT